MDPFVQCFCGWRDVGSLQEEKRQAIISESDTQMMVFSGRVWAHTCIGETAAAGVARTGMLLSGLRAVERT